MSNSKDEDFNWTFIIFFGFYIFYNLLKLLDIKDKKN